jgi:hypothetical protein
MPYISQKLRQLVRERAQEHCEYCKAPAAILVDMEVDHIRPLDAGGTTDADNLCLACSRCNNSKKTFQTAVDPISLLEVPLFNPRTQQWHSHFYWLADFTIIGGQTAVGRATIERLKMNRADIVTARHYWRKAGWQPPS